MTGLLAALGIVVKILPVIIELVQIVEAQAAKSGAGASKKDFVMGVVQVATQEYAGELGVSPEKTVSIVGQVIDLVVAFFNKIGIFKQ